MIIEGTTDSRLDELRGYDGIIEVGINNVKSIDSKNIVYEIDGILYTDNLITNTTTFKVQSNIKANQENLIAYQSNYDIEHYPKNYSNFSRGYISPFESLYRLRYVKNSRLDGLPKDFL